MNDQPSPSSAHGEGFFYAACTTIRFCVLCAAMTSADQEKQPKRGSLMKVNAGDYDVPAKGEKPSKAIGEPAKPMKSGDLF